MSTTGSRSLESRIERLALRGGLRPPGDVHQAWAQRRARLLAWLFSVSLHLVVFAALLHVAPSSLPVTPALSPILVSLVDFSEPKPPGQPSATEVATGVHDDTARQTPPHPAASTLVPAVATTPTPDNSDLLSESQLAGATSAGEQGVGGGGGGCDMALAVQQALRRDPLVRTAAEQANRLGKASILWNGDWVRSGAQDGKGLSAVREAVTWEVAFAPEACRNQRMHGLVLLSLEDGGTRFAVGSDDWRWSDLLGVHAVAADR